MSTCIHVTDALIVGCVSFWITWPKFKKTRRLRRRPNKRRISSSNASSSREAQRHSVRPSAHPSALINTHAATTALSQDWRCAKLRSLYCCRNHEENTVIFVCPSSIIVCRFEPVHAANRATDHFDWMLMFIFTDLFLRYR